MTTATQKSAPLPGTRPEGTRDEREAAARVQEMFGRIAPRYDFLNHLLSFSLDKLWRRRTARHFLHILRRPDARVLDLCCGTGDLAFALDRARSAALLGGGSQGVRQGDAKPVANIIERAALKDERILGDRSFSSDTRDASSSGALAPEASPHSEGRGFNPAVRGNPSSGVSTPESAIHRASIVGSDFVQGMLERANEKGRAAGRTVVFAAADAMNLPFPDASFDLVTTAFGFRNLANYEHGLQEFARVLKPCGELGILEFSEPQSGPFASVFRFYFRHILPRIGGAISGNSEAYKYLPGSVSKFPAPMELAALMEKTGFRGIRIASWNFGSVILHSARRA